MHYSGGPKFSAKYGRRQQHHHPETLGSSNEVLGVAGQAPAINRIAVKVPPFYRTNPSTWFKQVESQFVIAGINNSATKFHYIVANLPWL